MRYCSGSKERDLSAGIQSGRIAVFVVLAVLVLIAAGVIGFLKFSEQGHGTRRVRMRIPPRPVDESPVQAVQPDAAAVEADDDVGEAETAVVETVETESRAMPADEAPVVVPPEAGEAKTAAVKAERVEEEEAPAGIKPESVPDMDVGDAGLKISRVEISSDGKGPVQVESDPATSAALDLRLPPGREPTSREVSYYVSVGSFREKASADRLVARLIDEGLDAFSIYVELSRGKGSWHRVYIGPPLSKEEAIDLADALEGKRYLSPWVSRE
ncbi:SPOR domain-containing protein [Thermodesulfobacteriota bacterium]